MRAGNARSGKSEVRCFERIEKESSDFVSFLSFFFPFESLISLIRMIFSDADSVLLFFFV